MKSRDFKQVAKDSLKGHWFVAIIAAILAVLLGATSVTAYTISYNYSTEGEGENPDINPGNGAVQAFFNSIQENQDGQDDLYESDHTAFLQWWLGIMAVTLIGALISLFISMVIGSIAAVGYAQFNMDIIEGDDVKLRTMFSRVNQLGVTLRAKLLIFIRVFIGSLFFLIPGIVMMYSYAMVHHVLADNPEMNAREALRESKRIMRGNRWKLFCLELSFIGHYLLAFLTFGISYLHLVPFQQATYAAFYIEARNNK